jgi:uncharacterized membrane protein
VVVASVEAAMPVEPMVAVEAMMHVPAAWVTVPKAVTVHSARLARRANREDDRQRRDRHEYQLLEIPELFHGGYLSFLLHH